MKDRRGKRVRARSLPGECLELHRVHANEARSGIGQLRDLLADAAARLARGFGELTVLARQERAAGFACRATCLVPARAANDAPAARGMPRPAPGQVRGHDADLGRACRELVSALQFQDIADQLLGATAGRLERLEAIARELGRLAGASQGVLRRRPAPVRGAPVAAAVNQRSLGAGEIELF